MDTLNARPAGEVDAQSPARVAPTFRDLARPARTLPPMWGGPDVPGVPQGERPLRSMRRGVASSPCRRLSGLRRDPHRRARLGAARPFRRDPLRAVLLDAFGVM